MLDLHYKYLMTPYQLIFHDLTLFIKKGMLFEKEVLYNDVLHFYHGTITYGRQGEYAYLIISWSQDGKQKKVQLEAKPDNPVFEQMIGELEKRMPAKSLQGVPEAEALKTLGAFQLQRYLPIAASAVAFIIFTIVFIPEISHYLDRGFAETTVKDIGDRKNLGTSNVHLRCRILHGYRFDKATSSRSTAHYYRHYYPLVDSTWHPGDSIKVIAVYETHADSDSIEAITGLTGYIKNMTREKIDDDIRDHFAAIPALKMAPEPVLVEWTGEKHNMEHIPVIMGVLAGSLAFGVIVTTVAQRRRRARSAAQARS